MRVLLIGMSQFKVVVINSIDYLLHICSQYIIFRSATAQVCPLYTETTAPLVLIKKGGDYEEKNSQMASENVGV